MPGCKRKEIMHFEYRDSEDEAPEDISLQSSKEAALMQVNSYLKHIQQTKTKLKAKRQSQQKRNLAQKVEKRKLVSVSSQKLDPSLLESIAPVVVPNKSEEFVDSKKNEKRHMTFEDDSDPESEAEYIPLNSNEGIQPVCIESIGREPVLLQKAADFKHNQMFGSRVRRDTNSKDFLSRLAKRRVLSAQHK
ncbi:hypothetical protein CAPTEDRAFT_213212 [Capitella teleta]|uniref:Uncharacterized protein n=1 Tax=Capitella teleta TaxID=283909 RepID=R7VC61_CAPTE|nr:hypothetical protein CAPTEDRAFT_213212 [Capitella teleta]|eukprot:ELU16189.1 hypothetical protein CAPTEDRAFT_213212 [Capitella teleta]